MTRGAPNDNHAAPLWQTISLLGIAQIISWGSLYYTLTVLAAPIRRELGFNDLMIFGAFTLGQLLSGVAAPWVGRQIDSAGGRNVMTAGLDHCRAGTSRSRRGPRADSVCDGLDARRAGNGSVSVRSSVREPLSDRA